MTEVFPLIVDRSPNYASIYFTDRPGIGGYRVRAASTLDDAYGPTNGVGGAGTDAMFDVDKGGFFRSRSVRQRGWGVLEESTRGQTRAIFDLDEIRAILGAGTQVPPEGDLAFLRVQTRTPTGSFPVGNALEGPILILQNPEWFNVPRPSLSLSGTAPDIAGTVAGGQALPGTMEFRVPAFADSMIFTNHDAVDPVFLSVGQGIPFMQIDPGETITHTSGMKDSLLIAANGANPTFSVLIATVSGQR